MTGLSRPPLGTNPLDLAMATIALVEATHIPIVLTGDLAPGPAKPMTTAVGLMAEVQAIAYEPDPVRNDVLISVRVFDTVAHRDAYWNDLTQRMPSEPNKSDARFINCGPIVVVLDPNNMSSPYVDEWATEARNALEPAQGPCTVLPLVSNGRTTGRDPPLTPTQPPEAAPSHSIRR